MASFNKRWVAPTCAAKRSMWVMSLLITITLLLCAGCKSGPTTIHGTAYVDGTPASGAEIVLSAAGKEDVRVIAERNGYYEFRDVAPGKYMIRIVWANGCFNLGQGVEIRVFGGRRKVDLRD